jgi:predicted transcriptional regulator
MELTSAQREILIALIGLFRQNERSIRGEEIAEVIGRNPGTIRNQMQSLKALQLVDGVPGPKGGYKATAAAYRELDIDTMEHEAHVFVAKNGVEVQNVSVAEIDFTTVTHPDVCSAAIKIIGDIRQFNSGDDVQIGPTPVNKLTIKGEVCGRNEAENTVIIMVSEILSLPKTPIADYTTKELVTVNGDMTIQHAAKILINQKVHGAPVTLNKKIVGVISVTDIAKAVASEFKGLAKDIMTRDIVSIDAHCAVYDAIKLFDKHNVSRLLVLQNGVPLGLITRADVLRQVFKTASST